MARGLLKFLIPFTLLFLAPTFPLHAQNNADNTSVNSTDSSSDETTELKKKKDKEKDEETNFFVFNNVDRFDTVFFVRFGMDIAAVFILIRFIYFPVYRLREYFFTFFMFNAAIFLITFLLNNKSGLSTGAAFGMFAVFSLLRYRTENISARDMTYLFLTITIGLISSISKGNILETGLILSVILMGSFLLDGGVIMRTEFIKTIQYEHIDKIKPENTRELIEDLRARTGLNIHKVSIGRVDFLRDTVSLKIYYYLGKNEMPPNNDE